MSKAGVWRSLSSFNVVSRGGPDREGSAESPSTTGHSRGRGLAGVIRVHRGPDGCRSRRTTSVSRSRYVYLRRPSVEVREW